MPPPGVNPLGGVPNSERPAGDAVSGTRRSVAHLMGFHGWGSWLMMRHSSLVVLVFCLGLLGPAPHVAKAQTTTEGLPATAFPVFGSLGKRDPPKGDEDFVVPPFPEAYQSAQSAKALAASRYGFSWWYRAGSASQAAESAKYTCTQAWGDDCFIVGQEKKIVLEGEAITNFFFAKAEYIDLDADYDRVVLGSPDAPVNIIAYQAFTSPQSRDFHKKTFKHLRSKYIDKGLVRYAFRDLARNELDVKAGMIARCHPPDRFYEVVEAIFKKQKDWKKKEARLFDAVSKFGLAADELNACLANKEAETLILSSRHEGMNFLGVRFAPTFVINGYVYHGVRSKKRLSKILDRLLKENKG